MKNLFLPKKDELGNYVYHIGYGTLPLSWWRHFYITCPNGSLWITNSLTHDMIQLCINYPSLKATIIGLTQFWNVFADIQDVMGNSLNAMKTRLHASGRIGQMWTRNLYLLMCMVY